MARTDDHRPDPAARLWLRPSLGDGDRTLQPLHGPDGQRRAARCRCRGLLARQPELEQRQGRHDWQVVRRQHAVAGSDVRQRLPGHHSPNLRSHRSDGADVEERLERGPRPVHAQRGLRQLWPRRRHPGHRQCLSRLRTRPGCWHGRVRVGWRGRGHLLGGALLPATRTGQLQRLGIPDSGDARLERRPAHGGAHNQHPEAARNRCQGTVRTVGPRLP